MFYRINLTTLRSIVKIVKLNCMPSCSLSLFFRSCQLHLFTQRIPTAEQIVRVLHIVNHAPFEAKSINKMLNRAS
jgi:hypothetical protein